MYADNLQNEYKKLFTLDNEKFPLNWAKTWEQNLSRNKLENFIPPTIPFIGKNYEKYKILIYASAEVLTCNNHIKYLSSYGGKITNRHRHRFDNPKNKEEIDNFFPNVNCQPITNGALTLSAAYICQKANILDIPNNPRDFLENIAFGNFGKFSIDGKSNLDYANKAYYLNASLDYIETDLKILEPNYLIITAATTQKKNVKKLLNDSSITPNNIFKIYQMNFNNICNTNRINKNDYVPLTENELSKINPHFPIWHKHLDIKSITTKNDPDSKKYYKVYAYLNEEVLTKEKTANEI
ncbi:MAG: hypothetical protein FWE03_02235 [Firmicutes bacterium]|nr:hypothetical protein [Bacillota bacterium]